MQFYVSTIKIYTGHILSFLRIFVLLNYFTTYQFNLFSFSYSTAALISTFILFGQVDFIIKHYRNNPREIIKSTLRILYLTITFSFFLFITSVSLSKTSYIAISLFTLVHFSANILLGLVQAAYNYSKYSDYYLLRQLISIVSIFVLFIGYNIRGDSQIIVISLIESALMMSMFLHVFLKIYNSHKVDSTTNLIIESLHSFKFTFRYLNKINYNRLFFGLAAVTRSNCPNILNSSLFFILPNSTYYLFNILNYFKSILLLLAVPYKTSCYYFSSRKSLNRLQSHSNIAVISIIGSISILFALFHYVDLFNLNIFSEITFDDFISEFKARPFSMLNSYRYQIFTLSILIILSTLLYSLLDSSIYLIMKLSSMIGYSIYCYVYTGIAITMTILLSISIYSNSPPIVTIISISYLQLISISIAVLFSNIRNKQFLNKAKSN